MALQIAKPTNFGIDADYWRIGVFNLHPRGKTCQVVLDGYIDQDVRQSGAVPLHTSELTLDYVQVVEQGGNIAAAYTVIKTSFPEWEGAQDV